MNLYRAIFKRADGSTRPMTYAAQDDAQAKLCAEQWACGDKLLTVELDRALERPALLLI